MKAASWADARKSDTVSLFDLQHLSPKAIYALASGKYDDEVVELVLSAAATAQRHLNETDVSDIAKRGAMAAILKEIRDRGADSGPSRTVIPTHCGQRSGDCGQLLMSV